MKCQPRATQQTRLVKGRTLRYAGDVLWGTAGTYFEVRENVLTGTKGRTYGYRWAYFEVRRSVL